jgi:hypothetical protein
MIARTPVTSPACGRGRKIPHLAERCGAKRLDFAGEGNERRRPLTRLPRNKSGVADLSRKRERLSVGVAP